MARYHDGKSSSGEKKANPGPSGGVYSEGFANLPEEKVMREYPKAMYSGPVGYNDTREGIDMLAADNHKHMMKKGPR
jgi:hypothetical protein